MISVLPAFLSAAMIFLTIVSTFPAAAQSWDSAWEAYEVGDYPTALRRYKKFAEQGDPRAQFILGHMHNNGQGVPLDYAEAVKWYRLSAEQDNPLAQYRLGYMYSEGQGVPSDNAEAVKWYRLAAEQGNPYAQNSLGNMHYNGQGVPLDHAEAVRWYRLAAEQGNPYAQYNLGYMYSEGQGVPLDHAEAVKWYQLAADQGNPGAQYRLGYMHYNGQGVPLDYVEAVKWYRLAADQGYADAQNSLGNMHYNGQGVPLDYAEAVRWYRLAAEQGNPYAQYNLGYMHYNGQGVPLDYAEAARWYRLSAEQGDPYAQYNLGNMHYNGQGVPLDYAEAARWYQLAADQGDADAQFLLGRHYEMGKGLHQDLVMAYAWYSIAAFSASTLEDPSSLMHEIVEIEGSRRRIADLLSYEEQFDALDMARKWRSAVLEPDLSSQLDYNDANSTVTVQEVQRALAQLGYYAGTIDGFVGPITREAIRSFQSDAGLPVNGVISEQLENALVVAVRLFTASALQAKPMALERTATGSGFRVSAHGHVLTNDHVVSGCTEVRVPPYGPVKISARDEASDLAILEVPRGGSVAAFRQGLGIQQGAEVLTAGFPLHGLLASGVHVTVGTVSALAGTYNDRRQIQITAAIQPGNSGGPVVDTSGNTVGVVVSRLEQFEGTVSRNLQNVNFAVSAGTARAFLDSEGIEYVTAPSNAKRGQEEVAAAVRAFTVLVECWN